ncbi:RagB/SusD family nutrient uptake outer membrane protein [Rhodohalobacter sp. SW132]|uniref:RagB/SusD family nutrient uptake outer membrane protein n=2 Tax=Rhodohalobacter sp. SW132 TaxID=2293433 RepID=UPI000E24D049|nr:RagB/SusD family nutrient uptake outer membrane protein [Rhodohalobacter sp. SW132]REL29102.1 RagB/SusD family nutrient uptake outer membrane protein [Rhodohalobacter sp. SW132]
MMKSNILKITLITAALLAFMACDDMLQVEPQQSVGSEVATQSGTGILAVYHRGYRAQMFQNYWGQRMAIAGDALADNAVSNPDNSGRYTGEPINSLGSGVGGWGRYSGINDLNTVLKYVGDVDGLTDNQRVRIEGETLFLRALAYHDLVKVYGYEPNKIVDGWDRGVILRTEPTETIDAADLRSRASVVEVYNQIEEDLLRSISNLSQVDGNAPHFANLAAAHALLSRVYLYWERWDDAIDQATLAIEASPVGVAPPDAVAGMYSAEPNPESLFELKFTSSESLGVNVALSSALTPISWWDLLPSDELLATFSEDDVRNELYPLASENYPDDVPETNTNRYVAKYEATVATHTDNVPVIRISEVYLTRAEAYAESGDDASALADLNEIRTNRGLAALDSAPADFIEEILLERRRELAFEGHRWQDLKRKGWDVVKPAATGPAPTLVFGENIQFLSQIPNAQVTLNPNLEQNPGY